ncbi:MAG: hypothetical protein JNJ77_16770 [Planctomycetia bacterium]|nr:hypothetical protein [Planctomycetia bacterium]
MHQMAYLLMCGTLLSGCSSLNTIQESEYQQMRADGVLVEEKNPTLAACLGVLPGCGSFYTGNYVLGAVDLFTWPVSILWDPIAGYNEARVINYRASLACQQRIKKRELNELEIARDEGRVTQVEYNQSKRAIESKYGFE